MSYAIARGSEELVKQYQYFGSGHFFDRDSMRFFKSRITRNYRRLNDTEALFITTERGPLEDSPRRATIRRAKLVQYVRESDGRTCHKIEIDTVGEFNKLTLAEAKRQLEKL